MIPRGANVGMSNFTSGGYGQLFFRDGMLTSSIAVTTLSTVNLSKATHHSILGELSEQNTYAFRPSPDKKEIISSGEQAGVFEDVYAYVWGMYASCSFHFDPLRRVSGTSPYTDPVALLPNCSNLARVVLDLGDSPSRLDRFLQHVNEIFPSVKWVTASNPPEKNQVEVKISTVDRIKSRSDQLIPLSECGTGVGQVMAILLAAITSEEPKIIFIDEPNSFLHPAAAKKLIEILKRYSQHQYILTTHSAEIIAAAEPTTIHQTRWTGSESIVETNSYKSLQTKELVLAELGVTMSDVFGANAIVWVEGMTEQLNFPKLLAHELGRDGEINVKFVALRDVGSFDKPKLSSTLLWDAYKKMSSADVITPPTFGFCFDKEDRSEKEMTELETLSAGKVHFLPRRNYESYLISARAIAELLLGVQYHESVDISEEVVLAEIGKFASNRKNVGSKYWSGDIDNQKWLEKVDGAALLKATFAAVTKNMLSFEKVTHSSKLTDWLLKNDPSKLKQVASFVVQSCSTKTRT